MSDDAVIIHLFGRPSPAVPAAPPRATVPAPPRRPLSTVPALNMCDQPVVSGRCATLVDYDGVDFPCSGLLAYQAGRWQHVNACEDCYDSPEPCPDRIGHRSCTTPHPASCAHGACGEPVDIEVPCTTGAAGQCCGCCWVTGGHIDVDDAAGWAPTPTRWAQ